VIDRRRRLTRRLFSCRECPTKRTFSFQKQPITEMFSSDLELKSNSCTLLRILLFLLAALQIKCALRRKMRKVIKSSLFWDATPCILVKINRLLRETYRLHLHGQIVFATCFILVSDLDYSSILTMEMTCSSETSVDFPSQDAVAQK
jgi:hypothetical protein